MLELIVMKNAKQTLLQEVNNNELIIDSYDITITYPRRYEQILTKEKLTELIKNYIKVTYDEFCDVQIDSL